MRPLRTAGGVSEDHPLDAEHSSCGAIHLQTGRVPPRARRTASQLREGSYGRDLGTRPWDDSVGVGGTLRNCRSFLPGHQLEKATRNEPSAHGRAAGGKAPGVSVAHAAGLAVRFYKDLEESVINWESHVEAADGELHARTCISGMEEGSNAVVRSWRHESLALAQER